MDQEKEKVASGKKDGEEIFLGKKKGLSMVSGIGVQGANQWKAIMRKFHESHKETCNATPKEVRQVPRSKKDFLTGSSYEGSWNEFGFCGKGKYIFPYEGDKPRVIYEGQFEDGMFHGEGEQKYDCGATIQGKWKKGVLVERKLIFADGLEYADHDWHYCHEPDRRFTVEYDNGIEPAGRSYLTADQPSPEIPPGYYDTGDGFFCPITKNVYKYDDLTAILRSPCEKEQQWIIENCRLNPRDHIGPCPFLYEEWLEPTLEAEDTPPPSAKTKNYQEEILGREVYFALGRRASKRPTWNRISVPLFPNLDRRTSYSGDTSDFYRPIRDSSEVAMTRESVSGLPQPSVSSRKMSRVSMSSGFFGERGISFNAPPGESGKKPLTKTRSNLDTDSKSRHLINW